MIPPISHMYKLSPDRTPYYLDQPIGNGEVKIGLSEALLVYIGLPITYTIVGFAHT